ncbi:MAG: hypothetical protein ABH884_00350 [Candidatus Komeilibacteria bacterium]
MREELKFFFHPTGARYPTKQGSKCFLCSAEINADEGDFMDVEINPAQINELEKIFQFGIEANGDHAEVSTCKKHVVVIEMLYTALAKNRWTLTNDLLNTVKTNIRLTLANK